MNEMMKGWRTIAFNVLAGLPIVLEIIRSPEFGAVIPPQWAQWFALGVVLGNIALRFATTTAVGQK
jgi:hypothetical protein